jgi:predicted 2-oxoglutarate/Fe(II)-dependent dioxygenase YbiX
VTKRLQVLLEESELRDLQRVARAQRMTVAEWVRQTLRTARRREPLGQASRKLDVVRRAARHAFPAGDVDAMIREIEGGYLDPAQS